MKKCRVFLAILGVLACVSVGRADEDSAAAKMTRIGAVAWDQANLATLRSFGYSDVAGFLGSQGVEWGDLDISKADCHRPTCEHYHMYGFTWADLAGDGWYHLVVVLEAGGTSGRNQLLIYNRSSIGEINSQTIRGQEIQLQGSPESFIPKVIQDLDGDGKDELVIPTLFLGGHVAAAIWPKVYELENGKYVDASREFAGFYDTQVLPKLKSAIDEADEELGAAPPAPAVSRSPQSPITTHTTLESNCYSSAPCVIVGKDVLSASAPPTPILPATAGERPFWTQRRMMLNMTRDKILRVIGRDPDAGLAQARIWTKGSESEAYAAYVVLKDMGGHQQDLEAAELKAFPRGLRTD